MDPEQDAQDPPVQPAPPPDPGAESLESFGERARRAEIFRYNLSVDRAKQIAPDVALRASRLARKLQLPEDIVVANLDGFEKDLASDPAIDSRSVYRKAPTLHRWVQQHPAYAAWSLDDIAGLANLEELVRKDPMAWRRPDDALRAEAKEIAREVFAPDLPALDVQAPDVVRQSTGDAADDARLAAEQQEKVNLTRDAMAREEEIAFRELVADEDFIDSTSKLGPQEAVGALYRQNPSFMLPILGGVGDAAFATKLYDAARAVEAGTATPGQQRFLVRFQRLGAAMERRGTDVWGRAAEIVTQAVPYAAEFGMGQGGFRVASAGVRTWLRTAALNATQRGMLRTAAGTLAGAAAMTATVSAPRVLAESVRRQMPRVGMDDRFNLEVDSGESEGVLEALTKAYGSVFIDNLTETFGAGVVRALAPVKRAIAARWLARNPAASVDDFFRSVGRATGWHGPIGEIFEERAAEVLKAGAGLEDYRPPTAEQLLSEAIAFSVMQAPSTAVRGAAWGISRFRHGAPVMPPEVMPALSKVVQAIGGVKKAPEILAKLADDIGDATGARHVHVDGEVWATHFQGKGLDAKSAALEAGVNPEEYDAAVKAGGKLRIPLGAYLTMVAAEEAHASALNPHATLTSESLSPVEVEALAAEIAKEKGRAEKVKKARADRRAARAAQKPAQEATGQPAEATDPSEVAEEARDAFLEAVEAEAKVMRKAAERQMVAAGRGRSARAWGSILESRLVTRALLRGQKPSELYPDALPVMQQATAEEEARALRDAGREGEVSPALDVVERPAGEAPGAPEADAAVAVPGQAIPIPAGAIQTQSDPEGRKLYYQGKAIQGVPLPAPAFYYKSVKLIRSKLLGRTATADQVKAVLKDVKAEEREWLGLDAFLKDKKTVVVADLIAHLEANEIEIKEVVKGSNFDGGLNVGQERVRLQNEMESTARELRALGYEIEYDTDSPSDYVLVKNLTEGAYTSPDEVPDEAARELFQDYIADSTNLEDLEAGNPNVEGLEGGAAKFEQYTLPGYSQYRELLLTMPPKEIPANPTDGWTLERRKVPNIYSGEMSEHQIVKDSNGTYVFETAGMDESTEAEILEAASRHHYNTAKTVPGFRTSHFSEENILAHVRFNTREVDGKRMLFIEEIQSDWHQKGRKKGYSGEIAAPPGLKAGLSLVRFGDLSDESKDFIGGHDLTPADAWVIVSDGDGVPVVPFASEGATQEDALRNLHATSVEADVDLSEIFRPGSSDASVPNAPLKKTWHEFAFKRMVRWAAENGYDVIGWTTGEQQAERYDLSREVASIESVPRTDAVTGEVTRSVTINLKGNRVPGYIELGVDKDGKIDNATQTGYVDQSLMDIVGKDISDRVMSEREVTLQGRDLKIGGEGMKGFYDDILVAFANKLGKAHGAKVQDAAIETGVEKKSKAGGLSREQRADLRELADRANDLDFEEFNEEYEAIVGIPAPERMYEDLIDLLRDGSSGRPVVNNWVNAVSDLMKAMPKKGDAAVHSLPITDSLKELALGEGFTFFQGPKQPEKREGGIRGFTRFGAAVNIYATRKSDDSTFPHEWAHVWLEEMREDAEAIAAIAEPTEEQRQFLADARATLHFLGAKSWADVTTDMHERWAEGWEVFLKEGRAPSRALVGAFVRFKRWLTAIYERILGADVKLTPQIREVYSRLIATQDEIDAMKAAEFRRPTFEAQQLEKAGFTKDQAQRYLDAVKAAGDEAELAVASEAVQQLQREEQAWWKDEAAGLRPQVAAEVNARREWKAMSALQRGVWPDGVPMPEGVEGLKLSAPAIRADARWGERVLEDLPPPSMVVEEGGLTPDEAAEVLSMTGVPFESGDDLIKALISAVPPPGKPAEESEFRDEIRRLEAEAAGLEVMEAPLAADDKALTADVVEAAGDERDARGAAERLMESDLALARAEAEAMAEEIRSIQARGGVRLDDHGSREEQRAAAPRRLLPKRKGEGVPADELAQEFADRGLIRNAYVDELLDRLNQLVDAHDAAVRRQKAIKTREESYVAKARRSAAATIRQRVDALVDNRLQRERLHSLLRDVRGRQRAAVKEWRAQIIDREVAALMKEKYGDLREAGLDDAAEKAIHSEARGRVLKMEHDILRSEKWAAYKGFIASTTNRPLMVETIRAEAEIAVARMNVMDIDPQLYRRAEDKAAREAVKAALGNDVEAALKAQERRLINHELYRAARKTKERADKIARYAERLDAKSTRKIIGKAGDGYHEQVYGILDRYQFVRITNKKLLRRQAFREWVEAEKAAGRPINVSDRLLDENRRINYREIPYEELDDVYRTLRHLEEQARLKYELQTIAKGRAFEEVRDQAVASIKKNGPPVQPRDPGTRRPQDEPAKVIETMFKAHESLSTLVARLDGWEDNGVMWNLIMREGNRRQANEQVRLQKSWEELQALFAVYPALERGFVTPRFVKGQPGYDTGMFAPEFIPAIGRSMTKAERLCVALNMGNLDSADKVRGGMGWTDVQIQAILWSGEGRLTEKDVKFVQSIWDFLETFKAEFFALAKRADGEEPEAIPAQPFQTPYGTFRGGYYPLAFDSVEDDKTNARELEKRALATAEGGTYRASTKAGARNNRVKHKGKAIRLDLGVIFDHVIDITHDITHHEYVVDTLHLLNDEKVRGAIVERYGVSQHREIIAAITALAAGDKAPPMGYERVMAWLRSGVVTSMMAWKVAVAAIQPTGLTNSMARIGIEHVLKGAWRWLGSARDAEYTLAWIMEQSEFMRGRAQNLNRDQRDAMRSIGPNDYGALYEKSKYWMMYRMQLLADIPTWVGAFEKAKATMVTPGMTSEAAHALAVDFADQAVRDSQGSGQTIDQARVMRGGEGAKLLTTFYGFFSKTYNLMRRSVGKTDVRNPVDLVNLAIDLALLISIPALLNDVIKDAMRGGDERKRKKQLQDKFWRSQVGYLMGTMLLVREVGGGIQGYGYEGPVGAKGLGDLGDALFRLTDDKSKPSDWRAYNQAAGILFHYPAGQVDATLRGLEAYGRGDTSSPGAILIGPPSKR